MTTNSGYGTLSQLLSMRQ